MFQYNRITRNYMDLYFKGLHLQPNRKYELSMDVYGGPVNIFITNYGIATNSGSHYVDYTDTWTHCTFAFETSDDASGLTTFSEWGISLVKKEGERVPTDADDTYIDNVRLVCTDTPTVSVISGGDFEAPKSSAVYTENWKQEILGISGNSYGVEIVTDPLNRRNRCLLLPRISQQAEELPLPIRTNSFSCFKNSEQDVPFSKFRSPNDHLFLMVLHGEAEIETDNTTIRATSQQLVYLPPSVAGRLTLKRGSNTAYYHLTVNVSSEDTILSKLPLPELSPIPLQDVAALCACIDAMLQYPPQSKTYLYAVNGQLLLFLSELERQLKRNRSTGKYHPFIDLLAKHLRESPEEPLNTAEKAAECGLSECYFITLFKQYTGLAPHQYRLRELVNKACVLLQDTTMTIQEISYTLGIDDPLYFSRLFRSLQGISPRNYRKLRNR